MRIGIDFDDTIISQHRETIKILNKKYDYNIEYEKMLHWDMRESGYNITSDAIREVVYDFRPYFCKPTDKKIAKYFNKIGKKHEIDIVTSRWGPITLKFDIYFTLGTLGLFNWKQIILSGRKYKQNMGYDILVDDNPNMANNLIKDLKIQRHYGITPTILILYDQPWNWSIECEKYPNIYRAKNWKQVYKIIKSL